MIDVIPIKYFIIQEEGKKKEISEDERKKLTEQYDKYAQDLEKEKQA